MWLVFLDLHLPKYPNSPSHEQPPETSHLVVPEVSSETRRFIPIGFLSPEIIASNKLQMIPGASLFHFGIMSSTMHMAWMRVVAGRLESRFSYAPAVYNNFPWAEVAAEQKEAVERAAQAVLEARSDFLPPTGRSTLADLYDPTAMPPALAKAHAELDREVEKCYRKEPFSSDRERVEFLFSLYEKLTAPLVTPTSRRSGPV
jgi:hypothetical protein